MGFQAKLIDKVESWDVRKKNNRVHVRNVGSRKQPKCQIDSELTPSRRYGIALVHEQDSRERCGRISWPYVRQTFTQDGYYNGVTGQDRRNVA